MGFFELMVLAIGVSMDAFAVSVCKGLSSKKASLSNMGKCGLWFGGFQALMPLIGFYIGKLFAGAIEAVDHWIAFALLAFIGANMLKEAIVSEDGCECENDKNADFTFKTMLTMAIATSIDALAVGVSLSLAGGVNIFLAILLIGVTTCIFSAVGVKIGSIFGDRFEKKAQIAGGAILILIGLKILLEHLGVIGF
jgi:putative Mn2+ efflux pump MntP